MQVKLLSSNLFADSVKEFAGEVPLAAKSSGDFVEGQTPDLRILGKFHLAPLSSNLEFILGDMELLVNTSRVLKIASFLKLEESVWPKSKWARLKRSIAMSASAGNLLLIFPNLKNDLVLVMRGCLRQHLSYTVQSLLAREGSS